MNTDIQNLQTLLDAAVKGGLFEKAAGVVVIQQSLDALKLAVSKTDVPEKFVPPVQRDYSQEAGYP